MTNQIKGEVYFTRSLDLLSLMFVALTFLCYVFHLIIGKIIFRLREQEIGLTYSRQVSCSSIVFKVTIKYKSSVFLTYSLTCVKFSYY